jgi:enamine deaminase RidA (YjgF/YER057c/UK114 family)
MWREEAGVAVSLIAAKRLYSGAPYAYAAVAEGSGLVFTAGACPLDESGNVVAAGDIPTQMRQALSNLSEALAAAGCTIKDVLKTTVYVAASSREDLLAAWAEVSSYFGQHAAPSTLLGVSFLGYRDQLVEVEAVAQRPSI